MSWDSCPHCKLTIPRLIPPIWRATQDSTKLRGARIEYVALQDCVRAVPGVATFQVRLLKQDEQDIASRDILEIHVAPRAGTDEESLRQSICDALKAQLEIMPDIIRFMPADEIEKNLFALKLKAQWVVDMRPQTPDQEHS